MTKMVYLDDARRCAYHGTRKAWVQNITVDLVALGEYRCIVDGCAVLSDYGDPVYPVLPKFDEDCAFDVGDKVRTTWQKSVYGATYEGVIVGIGYADEQWLVQQDDGLTETVHEAFLERVQ